MYITFNQVRRAFWLNRQWKGFQGWGVRQNEYQADIRCEFVKYVDYLQRDGQINDQLANQITL